MGLFSEGAPQIGLFIVKLIISIILAGVLAGGFSSGTTPKPDVDPGLQLNTRSTKNPVRVVYGLQRVGGNDVYISTMGYHNNYLYVIQTLSEGEVFGLDYTGVALANNITAITKADPGVVSFRCTWIVDR